MDPLEKIIKELENRVSEDKKSIDREDATATIFENFIVRGLKLLEGTENITIAEKFTVAIMYAKAVMELRQQAALPPGRYEKKQQTKTKDFEDYDYREDELWKVYNSFNSNFSKTKFPPAVPGRPNKKD